MNLFADSDNDDITLLGSKMPKRKKNDNIYIFVDKKLSKAFKLSSDMPNSPVSQEVIGKSPKVLKWKSFGVNVVRNTEQDIETISSSSEVSTESGASAQSSQPAESMTYEVHAILDFTHEDVGVIFIVSSSIIF